MPHNWSDTQSGMLSIMQSCGQMSDGPEGTEFGVAMIVSDVVCYGSHNALPLDKHTMP
jgi:hypothetical protein